jgi:hypothetical protein
MEKKKISHLDAQRLSNAENFEQKRQVSVLHQFGAAGVEVGTDARANSLIFLLEQML